MIDVMEQGDIAVVEMHHGKANALDVAFCDALTLRFQRLRETSSRAVVLTGQGKMFSAGVDLPQMVEAGVPYIREFLPALHRLYDAIFNFPKPVVAAINGHAIAGGMELAQGTDLRVASDAAKLGVQEVKWAIFPGGGSTVRLPRQLPYARAMELLLTGDLISADEALTWGFLNRIVPPADVLEAALELAQRIAANGPIAVQAIRRSARACLGRPEEEAMSLEAKFSAPVFRSEDAREGPRAFMEKRTPVFYGR